jgi:uncharacterized LabA/DUF88 family protein
LPTRTNVYVDGYNLYYSRLKNTPYKWLDLVALFARQILAQQDPDAVVAVFKYFTSPVMARYARHGQASAEAQTQYLRALKAKCPDLQIIKGFHVLAPTGLPTYVQGHPPSKSLVSPVWMIEEKQTDVNLALHAYRDVCQGQCDQVVICSNDSDVEPALELIAGDFPDIKIGLVLPLKERVQDGARYANKRLVSKAHWVRHYIRDEELASSQLPTNVPTNKAAAKRPEHWHTS